MSLAIAKGLVLPTGSRFSIGAVPAAIAGVAPTLDFRPALERREIEAVSLADKLTFTGGNQGTFVGSDGYIQRAQTNVPRFTHDPVTRRSLGMRLEASGQNLLLRSEEFNQTWSTSRLRPFGSGSTANATIAPDGTKTADFIQQASGQTSAGVIFVLINTSTPTVFVHAKASTKSKISILTDGSGNGETWFDLANGTVGTKGSNHTADIINFDNGWYNCIVSSSVSGIAASIYLSDTDGSRTVTDSGGVFIWGAQLGPTLTSYIPTTTAAVTRTADSAVLDGTGVITGTYTMVEKPAGCAVVSGTNINLQPGFTVERVMIFPAALTAGQITAIRAAM